MSPLDSDSIIEIAPGLRFQWEEAQQSHVLLFPEGMVRLNASASEILKRCDGARTMDEIVKDLEREFPDADLHDDVRDFLEHACERGWLRLK